MQGLSTVFARLLAAVACRLANFRVADYPLKTRNATQGLVRRLPNSGRFSIRLEPPGHQRKEGEGQWRSISAETIACQNMRLDRAEHFEKDPSVSPFPESREPWPEQCTHCEGFPDSYNVQDISWIADRTDVLYDIRKARKIHERPHHDFQDKNGSAGCVNELSVHFEALRHFLRLCIQ